MKTARKPYESTFPGTSDQLAKVRAEIRAYLDGCPVAEDALLIIDEFASNAVTHSFSGVRGGTFTVSVRPFDGWVWAEVADEGGVWCPRDLDDDRPHGLDIVSLLIGPRNWGVKSFNGGTRRVVWARIDLVS